MKNILALSAHPDDIEYGCAGTLIKHINVGHNVYLYVATDGRAGGDKKIREQEQMIASNIIGIKETIFGRYKDTKLQLTKRLIGELDRIIIENKIDEIYVNYPEDSHQDHRILAQAVISAARYSKRLLFYGDYTSLNFQPDIFVDIEDVLDKKIKSMQAHHSQVTKVNPAGLDMIGIVKSVAEFRGFQAKVKYAEGFKALRFLNEI